MTEEYNTLIKNGTWSLFPQPSQNLVGCKWIFWIKRHANGSIEQYNAQLVAKGFKPLTNKSESIYSETFSTVVKSTTIRTVLSSH